METLHAVLVALHILQPPRTLYTQLFGDTTLRALLLYYLPLFVAAIAPLVSVLTAVVKEHLHQRRGEPRFSTAARPLVAHQQSAHDVLLAATPVPMGSQQPQMGDDLLVAIVEPPVSEPVSRRPTVRGRRNRARPHVPPLKATGALPTTITMEEAAKEAKKAALREQLRARSKLYAASSPAPAPLPNDSLQHRLVEDPPSIDVQLQEAAVSKCTPIASLRAHPPATAMDEAAKSGFSRAGIRSCEFPPKVKNRLGYDSCETVITNKTLYFI